MSTIIPSSFHVEIKRLGLLTYRLVSAQTLTVKQKQAFTFFEDPRNLCHITPEWLDFHMLNKQSNAQVYENSEFDYTIKVLGVKILWRSRIIDYQPPERFTDIQIKGPYKSWVHVHTLKEVPEGTFMRDEVTYQLYVPALPLHYFLIRKKLMDIFSYRAVMIANWAKRNT